MPSPPPPGPSPAPAPPPNIVPAPIPETPRATLALSPARNIIGTWRGKGFSYVMDGGTGQRLIKVTWDTTLQINSINDRIPQGTLTLIDIKHENLAGFTQPPQNWGPDPIRDAEVGDTRLYFRVDDWRWEFTFTSDLMSGHYTSKIPNECDPKAFVLNKLGL